MGNVEYDNSLRLAPNAYALEVDFWTGGGYGNGTGPDLRHGQRSHVRQPDRQHRHQHACRPTSFTCPTTHSFSAVVRAPDPVQPGASRTSYVGTRGRDLVSRSNGNVMPYGVLSSGTFNGVDLSVPINRVAVASVSDNLASFRPYNALNAITDYDFRGNSQLRLDAGHAEPTDRGQVPVLRRLHATARAAARSAPNTPRSTRTIRTGPTACSRATAPTC